MQPHKLLAILAAFTLVSVGSAAEKLPELSTTMSERGKLLFHFATVGIVVTVEVDRPSLGLTQEALQLSNRLTATDNQPATERF